MTQQLTVPDDWVIAASGVRAHKLRQEEIDQYLGRSYVRSLCKRVICLDTCRDASDDDPVCEICAYRHDNQTGLITPGPKKNDNHSKVRHPRYYELLSAHLSGRKWDRQEQARLSHWLKNGGAKLLTNIPASANNQPMKGHHHGTTPE